MANDRVIFRQRGTLRKTESFLKRILKPPIYNILDRYGRLGVAALANATPWDTGETAMSWWYEIEETEKGYRLSWVNSNVVNGFSVAILIQNGHATKSGTWVQGYDYINPALAPIFDQVSEELRKEVSD